MGHMPFTDPWVPDRGAVADPSAQTCMYGTNPDPGCGAPGAWHIAWDKGRQSISCNEHMTVTEGRWMYLDRHQLSPDCGMPGARWMPDRCEVPGTQSHMTEALAEPAEQLR